MAFKRKLGELRCALSVVMEVTATAGLTSISYPENADKKKNTHLNDPRLDIVFDIFPANFIKLIPSNLFPFFYVLDSYFTPKW